MRNGSDYLASVLHDDLGRIALERMAERIISGKEKPAVTATFDDLLRGTDRKRVRVKHPLHRIRRAKFAVEIGRPGRMGDEELLAVVGDLLNRQADCRDRHVDVQ